jgi:hypothetical protein
MEEKETVQSLRICSHRTDVQACTECPLFDNEDCMGDMMAGAADLIERLTAENADLCKEIEWKDMVIALAQRKQAEAEADRDAAIADLKISSGCASCKYHCSDPIFCRDCNKKQNCKCMSCSLGLTNWKWHGLPEAPEEGE